MSDSNGIIRTINKHLAIKNSQSKRRKVVTLTDIKKVEDALVSGVKDEFKKEYCNYCHEQTTKLSLCSRCRSSFYCSKECQKKAYKYHKSECLLIKEHPELGNYAFKVMNQILLKIEDDEKAKKYFDELIDHYEEFQESNDKLAKDFVKKLAIDIKKFTEYEGSLECLMKMINKINCNAISIFNDSLFNYAMGLFLQASNINHDCNPNCTEYYKGDTIYIKAVKDLSKGEEITISYVPFYDSCRNRQHNLKNYYFTCQCSRCLKYKDQLYLDPTEGIKCTTKNCDCYISHVEFNPCPKCHQNLPQERVNKVKRIKEYFQTKESKLINVLIPPNIENPINWLERLLKELKELLHPQNIYILATLNKLDAIIPDNDAQYDELFKSEKTLNNYEIYCYCQSQSLNPSCYNTYSMYYCLTNALNEIFDYIEEHRLQGKRMKKYVKEKLDAIHGSILSKKLETEAMITLDVNHIMYKNIQRTLLGYDNLIKASCY
ncbi:SET domain-containing protein [Neocallimastix sp. 'constans']